MELRSKRIKTKKSKKPKFTSLLAVIVTIMLLIYTTPIGMFSNAFALTNDSQTTTPIEETEGETNPQIEEQGESVGSGGSSPPSGEQTGDGETPLNGETSPQPLNEGPQPEVETYGVTVGQTINGNVQMSVNGVPYNGEETLEAGTVVHLQITPDSHYEINAVNMTVGNSEPQDITEGYTKGITVSGDTKIDVEFINKLFTVSLAENKQNNFGTVKVKTSNENEYTFGDRENPDEIKSNSGEKVYLTITPNEAYTVASVKMKVDGIAEQDITDTYRNGIELTGNTEFMVEYSKKTYTITFNSSENGSVNYDQTLETAGGTITLEHGSSTSFTAVPIVGYHVSDIEIDQRSINFSEETTSTENNGLKYSFKNVSADHTVSVTFEINTYPVSASVKGSGGTIHVTSQTVKHGDAVVITMTPDVTHKVDTLTVNGTVYQDITSNESFVEDENGQITFTVSNITKETNMEVVFTEVSTVDQAWENYLSITVDPTTGQQITEPILTAGDEKKFLFIRKMHN